jgi:Bacterial protein of unknown function (DUF885)
MVNGKWKMEKPNVQPLFSIYHLPFSIQAVVFQRPVSRSPIDKLMLMRFLLRSRALQPSGSRSLSGFLALILLATLSAPAVTAQQAQAQSPAWVADSNRHAKILLDLMARFGPEGAGQFGVEGLDEQITDISEAAQESGRQQLVAARATLQDALAAEKHPLVRQDLEILINAADQALRGRELGQTRRVPYVNVPGLVFGGLRALLDDQIPAPRRAAAVVRLRKYAGLVDGIEPVATVAARRARAKLNDPKLTPPARQQIERDLANGAILMQGLAKLFERYQIVGWREPYEALRTQLQEYEKFVRSEVLPKASTDFKLPPELYRYALDQVGVDVPAEKIAADARAAFKEIQTEMDRLAPAVAKARGLSVTGYRDVMRALKKEQLVGDAILAHYRKRLAEIEQIINREKLVTLPAREARIRIATEAEAAATPAPNMRPPRLIGNTGESAEFILPLNIPAAAGAKGTLQFDDFTFEAGSWTLTAHEARPGHELQFAKMIETGVSVPRAVFAFNSTNVEGWGLYAEWMLLPHMPPDGQLVSLQFRLLRAARAFLDPELHMGQVKPDEARRVLREDVVLSDAMTEQEVERYMFRTPSQATAYYYGYTNMRELRAEVEKAQGKRFDARAFHDFVLAQGLLPPKLLRDAVLKQFAAK